MPYQLGDGFRALLVGIVAIIPGCPLADLLDPPPGDMDPPGMEISGAALAQRILVDDPYLEWGQFPGAQGFIQAGFPHGPEARVFINDVLEGQLDSLDGAFPADSIIVKENDDEDFFGLANTLDIMWKVEGYAPDNGDWFWANITREGSVNFEGRIQICINCHRGAANNDFIFLHPLE